MYRMLSVDNISWNIATLWFIFNSFESWKGPFAWAVIDHQAKKSGFAWLHKLRTTNLRHQTQMHFCHFFAACLSHWGRVLQLPVGKVAFAYYSSLSRCSLICLTWKQYNLVQVVNSTLISEWFYLRKFKWKKKYQSSFMKYKCWQNYCVAQSPKKQLCFYCRILVALHIALLCRLR